eukprot:2417486-Prymnesium_polylepis.1
MPRGYHRRGRAAACVAFSPRAAAHAIQQHAALCHAALCHATRQGLSFVVSKTTNDHARGTTTNERRPRPRTTTTTTTAPGNTDHERTNKRSRTVANGRFCLIGSFAM